MIHRTKNMSKLALGAALTGLLAGTVALTGCTDQGQSKASERNGCSGPNGCGGHGDKKATDKNACSGPNGCNGHGTKK